MALDGWLLLLIAALASSVSCTSQPNAVEAHQASSSPTCMYITDLIPAWIFPYYAANGCYYYINPIRFLPGKKLKITGCPVVHENKIMYLPCYKSPNGDEIIIDHTDPKAQAIVRSTVLAEEDVLKWIQCSEAAVDCCNVMQNITVDEGDCPPTWDAWYCWGKGAPPGSFQKGACPDYIYTGSPPSCTHFQTKECFANGTWRTKTDYSGCSVTPPIYSRVYYHVAVLALSVLVSIPALIIFFSYRKLRVMRVALHRSLVLAIAIRNVLTIIYKTTLVLPELDVDTQGVISENGVPCRVLAFLERLAANAVFACMLLEGVYLHRLIAAAFRGEPSMTPVIVVAAVLACVPDISWSIVMATLHDSDCWYVDSDNTGFQWINDAPRLFMLLVNTILLIDIIRVLLTRLRAVRSDSEGKLRRTAKATIFLMPLFGVQLLLTMVRPDTKDCTAEQVYFFFAYATDGLLGFFVVLIYCFLNKEVQELVGRTIRNLTGLDRPSKEELSKRRTTLLTTLSPPQILTEDPLKSPSISSASPTPRPPE